MSAVPSTLAELRVQARPPAQELSNVRAGFNDLQGFELAQRGAKLLAMSDLVPDAFKGNIANCVVALEMAQRIGASALMVMQNLDIVHGRPTWRAQFVIACVNQCGRFSALRYEWTGKEGKDDWGCRAWAIEKGTNEKLRGPLVTIGLAKTEGWYSKKGSKWQSIPELMLMYRAGSWFGRTYAPELTMGLQTTEEARDIIDLNPDGSYVVTTDDLAAKVPAQPKPDAEDVPTQGKSPAPSFAEIADAMVKAATIEDIELIGDLIGSVADLNQRGELLALYRQRRSEIDPES